MEKEVSEPKDVETRCDCILAQSLFKFIGVPYGFPIVPVTLTKHVLIDVHFEMFASDGNTSAEITIPKGQAKTSPHNGFEYIDARSTFSTCPVRW